MNLENNLNAAFEAGFFNASASLSVLAGNKINYHPLYNGLHRVMAGDAMNLPFNHDGSQFLVTTEIFGDVSGKSYLFLSEREFAVLTAAVPESKNPNINFKEEFLKEVDNIISATVITRLANELNVKMYGDIPLLAECAGRSIERILFDDFNTQSDEVYVSSIVFFFEAHPAIRPLFAWVLDSRVLTKAPIA